MVLASEDMAMACSDRDRNRFDHDCSARARNIAGGSYSSVDSYRGFPAWIGARSQMARPRLFIRLSVTQRLGGRIVELHVCDGKAAIQPILENSGDLVAERSFVQLIFPP